MNVTASIHRHSAFFIAAFIPFAVIAFGYNFFIRELSSFVTVHHLHGVAMFGWLFLLLAQATLIRNGNRNLHRKLGKTSYAIVLFICLTTIILAHFSLTARGIGPIGNFIAALQFFLLLQFVLIYAMAIKNRRRPDIHARWMIGTIIPMIDPVFARIMTNILGLDLPVSLFTFIASDIILVTFIILDWKYHKRRDVFLPMLILCLATQVPVLALAGESAWNGLWSGFLTWFLGLPLS